MTWTGYPEEDPALYEAWAQQQEPEPTAEDYCAADGHAYYGNPLNCEDGKLHTQPGEVCTCGSCYCGAVQYDRFGNPPRRPP